MAHQRPVVVGEPAQLYDKVIHLATGRQPGAHHRLPALLRTSNGLVELQVAVESSVGRVADVAGEEDVLEDQATAGPHGPHHELDGPLRSRQVREEVAG